MLTVCSMVNPESLSMCHIDLCLSLLSGQRQNENVLASRGEDRCLCYLSAAEGGKRWAKNLFSTILGVCSRSRFERMHKPALSSRGTCFS